MSDLVNLNRARKAKAEAAQKAKAAENRARHGRTKAQKAAEKAAMHKAERRLDDTKRER